MQNVDDQPEATIDVIQGNREQSSRGAGQIRVDHARDKSDHQHEASKSQIIGQRMLMPDIGNLVRSHLVVRERAENAHDGHGQRQQACIVVTGRQADNDDSREPLACQVCKGACGIP